MHDKLLNRGQKILEKSLNKHLKPEYPKLNIKKIVTFWKNTTTWIIIFITSILFIYSFTTYLPSKGTTFQTTTTILLCLILFSLQNRKN